MYNKSEAIWKLDRQTDKVNNKVILCINIYIKTVPFKKKNKNFGAHTKIGLLRQKNKPCKKLFLQCKNCDHTSIRCIGKWYLLTKKSTSIFNRSKDAVSSELIKCLIFHNQQKKCIDYLLLDQMNVPIYQMNLH